MILRRYIAFKDSPYEVMEALDACNIKYDWYGHDDVWSVLRIHGVASTGTHDSSYEGALSYKGVHVE